jgi:hypothetical protein
MNTYLPAACLLIAAMSVPALAQDTEASPAFGEVSLSSGFTPDPYRITLNAGGSIDTAQTLGGECVGFIAGPPDFNVHYNATSFPLVISVAAQADTSLVIKGPDNRWYCDDDVSDASGPVIHVATPVSGTYNIWVGAFDGTKSTAATLSISELFSH